MEKICENCVHFRRHHVKYGFRYLAVGSDHCVYPRTKLRGERVPACKHYKEKPES